MEKVYSVVKEKLRRFLIPNQRDTLLVRNLTFSSRKKRVWMIGVSIAIIILGFYHITHGVIAEQSGSSPESGSTSRIKEAYDALVAKGTNYGSTDAADWTNNWGTYWNRIMEAAFWEPADSTAATGTVFTGSTFYSGSNNRTAQTGTLTLACAVSTFDASANLVSNALDGSGDGTNRWCMTDSGTAAAGNILSGLIAWVDGVAVTGTMTDREGDNASTAQAASGGVNYFTALSGFYDGDDRVSATDAQVAALDSDITASNILTGISIFGVEGSATSGSIDFTTFALQDYDDFNCVNNNEESATACAVGDSEYTGEEGTWTLTASGGTAVSVTDNAVTRSVSTNKVYKDERTGLYWSDRTSATVDNEFAYVDGDDRTNPTGASCNFNSTGTANQYCDNQDPLAGYTEDNDVSAAEFCLNLQLDGDNADADSDGTTGTETDWRLPTQKELMQAYINGIANNHVGVSAQHWSSTEIYDSQSNAWNVTLGYGLTNSTTKSGNIYVRCVRQG